MESLKTREKRIRQYARLAAEEACLGCIEFGEDVNSIMKRFSPPADYAFLYREEDAPFGEERRFFAAKGLIRAVYESVKEKAERMPIEITNQQIANEIKGKISLLPRAFVSQSFRENSMLYSLLIRPYVEGQVESRLGKTLGKLDRWLVKKVGLAELVEEEKKEFNGWQKYFQTSFERYVDKLVSEERK